MNKDKDSFHMAVQLKVEKEINDSNLRSVMSPFEITRVSQIAGKVAAEIYEEEKGARIE